VNVFGPGEAGVLHFNAAKKPFDDIRVRRAVAYALSRDEVVTTIGKTIAGPVYSEIPPRNRGGSPVRNSFNAARRTRKTTSMISTGIRPRSSWRSRLSQGDHHGNQHDGAGRIPGAHAEYRGPAQGSRGRGQAQSGRPCHLPQQHPERLNTSFSSTAGGRRPTCV